MFAFSFVSVGVVYRFMNVVLFIRIQVSAFVSVCGVGQGVSGDYP